MYLKLMVSVCSLCINECVFVCANVSDRGCQRVSALTYLHEYLMEGERGSDIWIKHASMTAVI